MASSIQCYPKTINKLLHFLKQLSNKHGRSYDGKNELLDDDGSYRRESGFIESSCSNVQNESQVPNDIFNVI